MLIVAAGFPLVLAGGAALLTVVIGQSCSGSGVGDAPSRGAAGDIPARVLAIYQQVGAQYKLPWEILAGIGKEECDHGLLPDPSCTPQPGAEGPGVANFAGASGPMQVGIGGAAGDEYDALRHFLPDPSLGPHDPTTAVELAALVLIKDKGAPRGQPIDAYLNYARAYNGAGAAAEAYAARHARRLLVEASWHYRKTPSRGITLQRRQDGQPANIIAISWQAQQRLHRVWQRLAEQRGKRRTIVAVAVARELTGFCWALARAD